MKSKGRYGQFVRWIFSIVDLLIVNLVFVFTIFLDYRVKAAAEGFSTRPMWLALNVAMLVCIYLYNDVHEKRVIYAERVVGKAVNLVLTHAGIFITLTSLLRQPDVPWEKVPVFYIVFFLALATWWVVSRQLVKLYRNRGFNFK